MTWTLRIANPSESHLKNACLVFAFESAVPKSNWRQPTLWKAYWGNRRLRECHWIWKADLLATQCPQLPADKLLQHWLSRNNTIHWITHPSATPASSSAITPSLGWLSLAALRLWDGRRPYLKTHGLRGMQGPLLITGFLQSGLQ